MYCKYEFRAGDQAVKGGKVQVGEVCGSKFGNEEYGGYCYPHAVTMGTVPQEKLDQTRQAKIISAQERKKRRAEAEVPSPEIQLNPRVLEAMGYTDPCYLKEEYAKFKTLNMRPTHVNYDEKMAFARWLETPKHLREPRTMAEAAEILGVTEKTLISWQTSPDVIDFMNSDIESRSLGMYKLAMYKLGECIDRGENKSIIGFLKYYDSKQEQRKKYNKGLDIPEEMQKEANDFGRSLGERNRGVALTAEKNMVKANVFKKEEPEIEQ